ncbi:MAG: DUF2845 domain-containing protein [Alcaligenaceae bacterium]|nr:MAG: DUF2845 domain-containing protein [Alcaligenaceae bacterium]
MAKKNSSGAGLFLLIALFGSSISAAFSWLVGNLVLIGITGLALVIVLVLISRQKARKRRLEHEAWVDGLREKYKQETIVQRIVNSEIWDGQTEAQLIDSRGEPVARDEKVLKTKRREIWKYEELRKGQFALRITVDNGKVVGWEQKGA